MLLLMFRSGDDRYGLDARRVVEVVPRVGLRPIPHAPQFVCGLLSYRGRVLPVLDFGSLIGANAGREALSTRIVVVEFTGRDRTARIVGLVAEEVSHVANVAPEQVVSPAMNLETAPYLGAMLRLDEGLVQMIDPDGLLSGPMQGALYGPPEEAR